MTSLIDWCYITYIYIAWKNIAPWFVLCGTCTAKNRLVIPILSNGLKLQKFDKESLWNKLLRKNKQDTAGFTLVGRILLAEQFNFPFLCIFSK